MLHFVTHHVIIKFHMCVVRALFTALLRWQERVAPYVYLLPFDQIAWRISDTVSVNAWRDFVTDKDLCFHSNYHGAQPSRITALKHIIRV